MGDLTTTRNPARVSPAAWVVRFAIASGIFLAVIFILFWPMWQSGHLKVQLGLACGDMLSQIRRSQTTNSGFILAVAQPECWPIDTNTRPSP
jgi:hypothetical protein